MLKYLKFSLACDIAFGVFLITWFVTRHVLYLIVCRSIVVDLWGGVEPGCYWGSNANLQGPVETPKGFSYLTVPFRDPQGLVCHTKTTIGAFLGLLVFLQIILLIWFVMIVRIAWKVVTGKNAEDTRSDDEEEEEEIIEPVDNHRFIEVPPLEEEVGVEDLHLGNRRLNHSQRYKKSTGTSSSVTLPHDRKELLGRIGCDKGA